MNIHPRFRANQASTLNLRPDTTQIVKDKHTQTHTHTHTYLHKYHQINQTQIYPKTYKILMYPANGQRMEVASRLKKGFSPHVQKL